jgi:protein-disulfide isomerase
MLVLLLLVGFMTLGNVDAQVVNVTIFTESQCPFCTRLLREQIWPFHATRPGVMNLQIIPFGKGRNVLVQVLFVILGNCEFTPDRRLACTCMHGSTECDCKFL